MNTDSWISVKDRLPEVGKAVLVVVKQLDFDDNRYYYTVHSGYFCNNSYRGSSWYTTTHVSEDRVREENECEVIAWIPMIDHPDDA
jgi:hypothetical protein